MAKISVIGAGTWGTALAILLHGNGNQVTIWSALPGEVEELNSTRVHRNLPKARIPSEIEITGDLKSAMEERDLLVLAVPSVFVRSTARRMREFLRPGQIVAVSYTHLSLYPLVDYNCFARRRNPFAYPGPGTGTP